MDRGACDWFMSKYIKIKLENSYKQNHASVWDPLFNMFVSQSNVDVSIGKNGYHPLLTVRTNQVRGQDCKLTRWPLQPHPIRLTSFSSSSPVVLSWPILYGGSTRRLHRIWYLTTLEKSFFLSMDPKKLYRDSFISIWGPNKDHHTSIYTPRVSCVPALQRNFWGGVQFFAFLRSTYLGFGTRDEVERKAVAGGAVNRNP